MRGTGSARTRFCRSLGLGCARGVCCSGGLAGAHQRKRVSNAWDPERFGAIIGPASLGTNRSTTLNSGTAHPRLRTDSARSSLASRALYQPRLPPAGPALHSSLVAAKCKKSDKAGADYHLAVTAGHSRELPAAKRRASRSHQPCCALPPKAPAHRTSRLCRRSSRRKKAQRQSTRSMRRSCALSHPSAKICRRSSGFNRSGSASSSTSNESQAAPSPPVSPEAAAAEAAEDADGRSGRAYLPTGNEREMISQWRWLGSINIAHKNRSITIEKGKSEADPSVVSRRSGRVPPRGIRGRA